MDDGRSADAERVFRWRQFCYAALMVQCPKMPLYRSEHGRASHGLARSLAEQKKLDDAQKVLQNAEQLLAKLASEYPQVTAYRVDLLKSRIDHANLLADAGRLDDGAQSGPSSLARRDRRRRQVAADPGYSPALGETAE